MVEMNKWHISVGGMLVAVVVACSGRSFDGGDDGAGAGGEAGDPSGGGGTSGGGSSPGGTGGTGGSPGGTGGSGPIGGSNTGGSGPACRTSMDCPVVDLPCSPCPNGELACHSADCVGGNCFPRPPKCPECQTDAECPVPPLECVTCPDGTTSCPSPECSGRECLIRWSGCVGIDPCAGLTCGEVCNPCNGSDCPVMELPYTCNAEGECTTARPACLGRCTTYLDCPPPPPDCIGCTDGVCPGVDCIQGACEFTCDTRQRCETLMDCEPTLLCRVCPDGSCAGQACIEERCDFACP